jgi:DNA helicase-2/ATP-dependent DNA helicase PcrA
MIRSLRSHARRSQPTLRDAAWHVRDVTRRIGRREDRRTVSRTLLVKGLEYDHAIVLKADELNAKNLYVAMTRGRSSITVIAPEAIVQFPQPHNLLA